MAQALRGSSTRWVLRDPGIPGIQGHLGYNASTPAVGSEPVAPLTVAPSADEAMADEDAMTSSDEDADAWAALDIAEAEAEARRQAIAVAKANGMAMYHASLAMPRAVGKLSAAVKLSQDNHSFC